MRLRTISFEPFGALSNVKLDFGDQPGALHVVWGPNEAGKSTALRGILGFFFEIDHQSRDRHDSGVELRIRAQLEPGSGVVDWVRRKGRKHTLRDGSTDAVVPEHEMIRVLGGIDKQTFSQLYALDHVRLREGAESILRGEGRLGELLLEASTGSTGLAERLASLRAEADALYAPKRRTTELHKAVDVYREAVRQMGQASLSHTSWIEQKRGIEDTKKQVDEAEASLRELRERRGKLETVVRLGPPWRRLRKMRGRRVELGLVADVPEGSAAARDELERETRQTDLEAERAEAELPKLAADLAARRERAESVAPDLDRAALRDLRGELDRLRRALATAEAERDAHARALDEATSMLGAPPLGAAWKDLSLDVRTTARMQSLVATRDAALAARTAARRAHEEAVSRLVPFPASLVAEPAADLERAIGEGRRAVAAARTSEELAEREIALATRLASIVAATSAGDREALERLVLPSAAELEDEARRRAGQAVDHAALARELAAATHRHREARAGLDRLQGAAELPSEDQLRAARTSRDAALAAVRCGTALGDPPSLRVEVERLSEGIREADALADRLRSEAARIEQAASLHAECRAAEAAAFALRADLERSTQDEARRIAAFTARVPGGAAQGLDALGDLIARRGEALTVGAELDGLRARRKALAAEIEGATRRLDGGTGTPLRGTSGELEGALAAAERRAEQQRLAARDREGALATARASSESVAAAERDLTRAESAYTEAVTAFAGATAALPLASDATAEETRALLDALHHHAAARRGHETFARRAAVVAQDLAATEARWRAALSHAGLAGASPDEAILRADAALEARAEAPRLEAMVQAKTEVAAAARARADRTRAKLAEHAVRTGVLSEGLALAEENAREARSLDRDIAREEHVLIEISEEPSLAAAEARLRGIDFEATEETLERLRTDIEALESRRDRDLRTEGEFRRGLTELGSDSAAADLAQAAQSHLQRARDLARRAAVARAAVALLEGEVERHRSERAGPALGRASTLFGALTAGRWSGLRSEEADDGTPEIRAVREQRGYTVEALSEGTRDQLYLALRLAAIEHHAQTGVALPLVLDDVLVHFDDERTEAAIVALADVAKTVQVLLFTHEQRVGEIARRILAPGDVVLHELARTP